MGNFLYSEEKDIFGSKSSFRDLMENYVETLVNAGVWFTVSEEPTPASINILNIADAEKKTWGSVLFGGKENPNGLQGFISSLLAFKDETIENGIKDDSFVGCVNSDGEMFGGSLLGQEGYDITQVYQYFLENYMCYIEIPKISYQNEMGVKKRSFEKIVATSSLDVVSLWLNDDLTFSRYRDQLEDSGYFLNEIDYVKLTRTKEGVNKAVCPRTPIDLLQSGLRVVPMFLLKKGVDALYTIMQKEMVTVTFSKDNGTDREICTTLNWDIIKEIYGEDSDFFICAKENSYSGDFLGNSAFMRGYIRVPEVGGSMYDDGTRSINYARIKKLEIGSSPDLSLIKIDLATIPDLFRKGVLNNRDSSKDIIDMVKAFDLDGGFWAESAPLTAGSLLDWFESNEIVLSTVFLRKVCYVMLANPFWFGDITIRPNSVVTFSSGDVGLA